MSALPATLARWEPLVADFPKEIAACVGPWLEPLARAIGPLRAQTRRGEGEPDGVDGVTRRAPFDRLLDTERLLATEVPDEFVRRAAQSELLFHALALKETRPARASLVLVDAGPSQLGAPRLVHLALALVLASRAKEAGARFAWGLLQDPPAEGRAPKLVTGVEAPLPALMILDRRALEASRHDIAAWAEFTARAGWDDVWLVGADVTPLTGVRGGAVRITDPAMRGVARLDVVIEQQRRTVHRALPLPDAATQAAVLRDPKALFAKPAPASAPVPPTDNDLLASPPVFLCDGRKVAVIDARGDVLVYTVPIPPKRKRSRPQRWTRSPDETVLAVGWAGHRLIVLTRSPRGVTRLDWRDDFFPRARGALTPASPDALPRDRGDAEPPAVLHFLTNSNERKRDALLLGRDGAVLHVAANNALRVWTRHAFALDTVLQTTIIACAEADESAMKDPTVQRTTLGTNRAQAHIRGSYWKHRVIFSADAAGLVWRPEMPDAAPIFVAPGDTVVGGTGDAKPGDPGRLVAITADRHRIVTYGSAGEATLLRYGEGIRGAAVSALGRELAVVMVSGALRVYALPSLHVLVERGRVEGVA